MSSRGPYPRHATEFKIQLSQDIRSDAVGHCEAAMRYNLSIMARHRCPNRYSRAHPGEVAASVPQGRKFPGVQQSDVRNGHDHLSRQCRRASQASPDVLRREQQDHPQTRLEGTLGLCLARRPTCACSCPERISPVHERSGHQARLRLRVSCRQRAAFTVLLSLGLFHDEVRMFRFVRELRHFSAN